MQCPFHSISLQGITSAFNRVPIRLHGHPSLKADERCRVNGGQAGHGAAFCNDDLREFRGAYQFVGTFGLHHPEVVMCITQANGMGVTLSRDRFLAMKLSNIACVSVERRPTLF